MNNIILTCGPSSESSESLSTMASVAGGFRLNVAHLTSEQLETWLQKLLQLRADTGRNFRIVLDLQGAKVRIGHYPAVNDLPDTIELFYGNCSEEICRIPVPSESVFAYTDVGDQLFLNDRKVIVRVCKKSDHSLMARVEQNGPLSSGKGLNSPDRVFEMARVMPGDAQAIRQTLHIDNLDYAVSFVSDGREASLFRPLAGAKRLIAKIEQRAAFANLKNIDANFDEFWLCRGDLGAEAGFKDLGFYQRLFVEAIKTFSHPSLLAGEVLGSMVVSPQPSRAEIVQLYDAMHDGFAGIVLSDETACGCQINAVVNFLKSFF